MVSDSVIVMLVDKIFGLCTVQSCTNRLLSCMSIVVEWKRGRTRH